MNVQPISNLKIATNRKLFKKNPKNPTNPGIDLVNMLKDILTSCAFLSYFSMTAFWLKQILNAIQKALCTKSSSDGKTQALKEVVWKIV